VRLELKNGCGEPLYSGELRECGGQSAAVQEVQGLFKTNITWPTTQIAVAELMRIQEQHNLAFFLSTSWLDAMCHLGESINVAAIAQEIPDKPTPSSAWHACCKHGTTFWLGRVCATKEDAEKELLDSEHHGHKEGRVTPIPAPD
jgi:hypothetical protein